jgi:hypothetical protein
MLLSESELSECGAASRPTRFQLHRAPTDNDRGGYLSGWQAAGMDSEMLMALNKRYFSANEIENDKFISKSSPSDSRSPQDAMDLNNSTNCLNGDKSIRAFQSRRSHSLQPISGEDAARLMSQSILNNDKTCKEVPLQGKTELPFLSVTHVLVNAAVKTAPFNSPQRSQGLKHSTSSVTNVPMESTHLLENNKTQSFSKTEDATEAFGVTCKWRMHPSHINR